MTNTIKLNVTTVNGLKKNQKRSVDTDDTIPLDTIQYV